MKIWINKKQLVWGGAWKIFPVINCDSVKDIPIDYPGAIGVPITVLTKILPNDGRSGFLLVDIVRPSIGGKELYNRAIIRNLRPSLPEKIDLIEWFDKTGVRYALSEGGAIFVTRRSNDADKG